MATLTVAILTQNEAKRIGACIRSAQFADQVLVIDGGSTDGTADLARGLGAEVHVYADWQGFAAQRNRQIAHARGDFILFLDADEEITTELRTELMARADALEALVREQAAESNRTVAAYLGEIEDKLDRVLPPDRG